MSRVFLPRKWSYYLGEQRPINQIVAGFVPDPIPPTPSPTPNVTPTNTPTPSVTPTITPTPSATYSPPVTPSITPTNTLTPTPTGTPASTPTPTPTPAPDYFLQAESGDNLQTEFAFNILPESAPSSYTSFFVSPKFVNATPATAYYSYNGLTWNTVNYDVSPGTGYFSQAIYDGSQWILVGTQTSPSTTGRLYTSTDGINFSYTATTGLEANRYSIAYNGTYYVCATSSGTDVNRLQRSTDLINWSGSTSIDSSTGTMRDVIWDGNRFVAMSAGGFGKVFYSYDAENWYYMDNNVSSFLNDGNSVFAQGSLLLAVGQPTGGNQGITYSTDSGSTWNQGTGLTDIQCVRVAYDGSSTYVAATDKGLYYSTDAIDWYVSNITYSTLLDTDVVWTGTVFYGLKSGLVYVSSDGITWGIYSGGPDNPGKAFFLE